MDDTVLLCHPLLYKWRIVLNLSKIKKIVAAAFISMTFCCFAQNESRDVPYTKELRTFINAYFNHDLTTRAQADKLFNAVKEKMPADFTEYQVETTLSRADYYMGQYIMETYDLTQLEHALDDTSKEFEEPEERNKRIKAEAATFYESGMVHGAKAMEMKEECPDAMAAYTQALSGNIIVQPIGYVLKHGTKIAQYAKKTVKMFPKSGIGWFLVSAQSCYAPGIFGSPTKGRQQMTSYLEDPEMVCEKLDKYNYTCAIAYTYYRQNKFALAKEWYTKCLDYYPKNYCALDFIKKCDAALACK